MARFPGKASQHLEEAETFDGVRVLFGVASKAELDLFRVPGEVEDRVPGGRVGGGGSVAFDVYEVVDRATSYALEKDAGHLDVWPSPVPKSDGERVAGAALVGSGGDLPDVDPGEDVFVVFVSCERELGHFPVERRQHLRGPSDGRESRRAVDVLGGHLQVDREAFEGGSGDRVQERSHAIFWTGYLERPQVGERDGRSQVGVRRQVRANRDLGDGVAGERGEQVADGMGSRVAPAEGSVLEPIYGDPCQGAAVPQQLDGEDDALELEGGDAIEWPDVRVDFDARVVTGIVGREGEGALADRQSAQAHEGMIEDPREAAAVERDDRQLAYLVVVVVDELHGELEAEMLADERFDFLQRAERLALHHRLRPQGPMPGVPEVGRPHPGVVPEASVPLDGHLVPDEPAPAGTPDLLGREPARAG